MTDLSIPAVLVGAAAAFVTGGIYYASLGGKAETSEAAAAAGDPPSWTYAAELLRCLVLAAVVGGLVALGDVDALVDGLLLGLALWIGFPLVLWAGALIHEGTPWRLAAVHAGDWLLKLLLVAAIASAWQ